MGPDQRTATRFGCVVLRFDDYLLDLDREELWRGGEVVSIEPQAMRILAVLIEARDRVVTKEELMDEVWGDRFVSESALTTQIKELRRAVGDTGRDQRVIRTAHGRGYRFAAPVEETADGGAGGVTAASGVGQPGPAGTAEGRVGDGGARVAPPVRANPLIAVLPFTSLSGEAGHEHVADGLIHDIITALSKHRWLRVLPRPTAAQYATGADDVIGRLRNELDVHYVVEGSVRLHDDRLRITTSLTDAVQGAHVWADRYDRRIDDLFEVLDEITDLIVAAIEPEVGYAERARVARGPRTTLAAWDLFHLGVAHFFRFTAEDNLEAQRMLDECRRLDPSFPDAQAWWAYAVVLGMVYWDTEPSQESLDEALAATQQALNIDGHNAVFHALRGRVQLARREYGLALADNRRALELNPTFAGAWCGLGDSLCYEGAYDEAIEHFTHAVSIGTHDPQRWAFLSYGALALLFAGRHEEAVDWAEQAMTIPNCQYWTWAHKTVALAQLGRLDEARATAATLVAMQPGFTVDFARRRLFYLKRPEQLEGYLGGLAAAGVEPG